MLTIYAPLENIESKAWEVLGGVMKSWPTAYQTLDNSKATDPLDDAPLAPESRSSDPPRPVPPVPPWTRTLPPSLPVESPPCSDALPPVPAADDEPAENIREPP